MTVAEDIRLHSGDIELHIAPSTGKITRLMHNTSNLLVEPHAHEWTRALTDENRNRFESLDAWGGDECFPTVGGSALWGHRDHGDVWGKSPTVNFAHDNECSTGWNTGQNHFKRTIRAGECPGGSDIVGIFSFHVQFNQSLVTPGPIGGGMLAARTWALYASHTLFAAHPGDVVEWGYLTGISALRSLDRDSFTRNAYAQKVFAADNQPLASKFFVQNDQSRLFYTSMLCKRLGLRIDVVQDQSLPWVGIWWCHNAWGDGRPHSTVGIEPTNCPGDGPVLTLVGSEGNEITTAQFAWIVSKLP